MVEAAVLSKAQDQYPGQNARHTAWRLAVKHKRKTGATLFQICEETEYGTLELLSWDIHLICFYQNIVTSRQKDWQAVDLNGLSICNQSLGHNTYYTHAHCQYNSCPRSSPNWFQR